MCTSPWRLHLSWQQPAELPDRACLHVPSGILLQGRRQLPPPCAGPNPHAIDGILLTKFDTIDDKARPAVMS